LFGNELGKIKMVEQAVIEEWWERLEFEERLGLLFYSDMVELKIAAGFVAKAPYVSLRREIQEVIQKAFLEGRAPNGFWFGITWILDCPLCRQQSTEKGSLRFQSESPQELRAYLAKQGAACMNCGKIPPQGVDVQVQVLKAPLAVLRELGYAAPEANRPSTGSRYLDAWIKAKERESFPSSATLQ